MSNFTIEIKAPELVKILADLLQALKGEAVNSLTPHALETPAPAQAPAPLPQTFPQMAAQQAIVPASAPFALDNGAHSDNPAYAPAPVQQPAYTPPVTQAPQPPQYQYPPQQYTAPVNPTPTAPTYPNQMTGAVSMAPAATPAPVPNAPTTFPSNQVPVAAAPAFTLEQISIASAPLMDAGKGPDLVNLLHKFNVQAITQLPKDQYGAFATELRQLGAHI